MIMIMIVIVIIIIIIIIIINAVVVYTKVDDVERRSEKKRIGKEKKIKLVQTKGRKSHKTKNSKKKLNI